MQLDDYDLIIINSSGGKDSVCALWEVCRIAKLQNYSFDKIYISHQDLTVAEWAGVYELVERQAFQLGIKTKIYCSRRRNAAGKEENLLEYAERRKKWPSSKQRWCTSDFKRGPGNRVLVHLANKFKASKVLQVFGFRKEESPFRSKKESLIINRNLTTKSRTVFEWLPVHNWTEAQVWDTIKSNNLPYHFAYDLGMPRLSCTFCIFSPFDALVLAGLHNPEKLQKYVEVEDKIQHTFKPDLSLRSVQQAIADGYRPKLIPNWKM